MQLSINSNVITTFRIQAFFDLYNRKVTFEDISTYAGSSGSGIFSVAGISFLLEDQQGVKLTEIDFADPTKYFVPSVTNKLDVDLSSLPYSYLFQTYKIQCAIDDGQGNIYYTTPVFKKICQPSNMADNGFVPGSFQIGPNCLDNILTVKDLTPFVYNGQTPVSTTKSGTLYYPTGTISPVTFTGTPFSNNAIYTGQYRIVCTAISEYDQGDDVYVDVTYKTDNIFDITCANRIGDLMCCLVDLQNTYLKNCNNAIGKNAKDKLDDILIPFLIGLSKEINGQDASAEADMIKKTLNCDCGGSALRQNELNPINPSAYSIVITGVGGTTVPAPIVNGTTKTFSVISNVYKVAKFDPNDLSLDISVDTSSPNAIKYLIRINHFIIGQKVLNAIGADPNLLNLLNSYINTQANINLSGLDGKCITDISDIDYFLTQNINASTKVLVIGTATNNYSAPPNLLASNVASVQSWLNGLGIGSFTVTLGVGGTSIGIQSLNNNNLLSFVSFNNPDNTNYFQRTNATIVSVLQAIIDYLCDLTALKSTLANIITLWQIDYNGLPASQSYGVGDTQAAFNQGVADSIYNIVQRIYTLTGITFAKIKAVFSDDPSAVIGPNGRIYGTPEGISGVGFTDKQIAKMVIDAINKYADVKGLFCAIDCEEPASCPDITNISLAMASATSIGIYNVSWSNTPQASQTVSVYYKRSDLATWTLLNSALQILPNGNIQGNSPYQIPLVVQGVSYDIKVINNCGGEGFVTQITVPVQGVYSGSYQYGNVLYNLCGGATFTLYTPTPFAIGVIMYANIGLTTPLTGYSYIADGATGDVYSLNPATGEVLAATGNSCATGVANKVFLGPNTSLCGNTSLVRYTNGAFGIGKVLYVDASLTTPVTGYAYVLDVANGHIYNINSISGIIGADTGLTCSAYSGTYKRSNSEGTICAAGTETLYSAQAFDEGVTMYTDSNLTTPATGYLYIADVNGVIYNMNSVTGLVGAATGNAC
jgi:hypothetical protein